MWLKIPAPGGCGKNSAQPVLQASIVTCFRGIQRSGVQGRRENNSKTQPKKHNQSKSAQKRKKHPLSAQIEWAACILSVTSVCDRNSSVVVSSSSSNAFVGFGGVVCCWLADSFLFQCSCVCIYVNSFFSSVRSFPTAQLSQGELLTSVRPQSNSTSSSSNTVQCLPKSR